MKLNEKEENIYEIFKNWFYQDNMLIIKIGKLVKCCSNLPYIILAKMPDVARHFLANVTPRVAMGLLKKFSQFGSVIWSTLANIQIYKRRALLNFVFVLYSLL